MQGEVEAGLRLWEPSLTRGWCSKPGVVSVDRGGVGRLLEVTGQRTLGSNRGHQDQL